MERQPDNGADVTQMDSGRLQGLRGAGQLTARDLLAASMARIESSGVNAVRAVNPDAWAMAEASDDRQRHGVLLGPLDGIPVLVKDNIDTGDQMPTTAGSVALEGSRAQADAFLVRRLRRSGAVLVGKANLTEWANWMADHMPPGYSSLGGQVLNPYGPGRWTVGGSSSGSGAGVAVGVATLAVGTETSGSILSPASSNGIVGIKPTVGLISRRGIAPISWSQDTPGPMARTVADAALLLQVLAGRDRGDRATWTQPAIPAYTSALTADALEGVRLGVPRRGYWDRLRGERRVAADRALVALERLGATLVDVALPTWGEMPGRDVLRYEFKPAINAYLARRHGAAVRTLTELIRFNKTHEARALAYGQAVLLASEGTRGDLTEAAYWSARRDDLRCSREEGIDRALGEHGLSALVFEGNMGAGIAAKAGYPSVTVPVGYTAGGKPVGLTFTGTAWTEGALLGLAFAFEQGTLARVAPRG